jgi:hypothetical protein
MAERHGHGLFSHRVVIFHTLRKGVCTGITVCATVPVCSLKDARSTLEALRKNLDVVESRIEVANVREWTPVEVG